MNDIVVETADGVVLTVLTYLENGKIDEAIACFANEITFKDRGIGLEFEGRDRLAEFFHKTRELYPDSLLQTDKIFVSGENVITEWTLQFTLIEPLYGHFSRNVRVSVHGISVVQIDNGKITEWTDYYDGSTSRRSGLVSYFTEWVEL